MYFTSYYSYNNLTYIIPNKLKIFILARYCLQLNGQVPPLATEKFQSVTPTCNHGSHRYSIYITI